MNTTSATYVSPRDRAMSEILREMRSMSLPDLVYLRDQAHLLNQARLQEQAALAARYPLTPEATHDHAE